MAKKSKTAAEPTGTAAPTKVEDTQPAVNNTQPALHVEVELEGVDEEALIFPHDEDDPEHKAAIAEIESESKDEDVPTDGEATQEGPENEGQGDEPEAEPSETGDEDDGESRDSEAEVIKLKLDGRELEVRARVEGEEAEQLLQLAQKGLGAEARFTEAALLRREIEPFRPLIAKLQSDPNFAKHVLSYGLPDQSAGPPRTSDQAEPAAGREGEDEYDPELRSHLMKVPEFRQLIEENRALKEELGRMSEAVRPIATREASEAMVVQAERSLEAMGVPVEGFRDFLMNDLGPRFAEMLASPDEQVRAMAAQLDRDPNLWIQEYLAHRLREGSSTTKSEPPKESGEKGGQAEKKLTTKRAIKAPAPRDSSARRGAESDEPEEWEVLRRKALETGDEDDVARAIAAIV